MILTAIPVSAVPLAVFLTSDEWEQTIYMAFELLKEVLPYSGNGPSVRP